MIELLQGSERKTALVPASRLPEIPPGPPLSLDDIENKVLHRVFELRQETLGLVTKSLSRNDDIVHDLKEYQHVERQREVTFKILADRLSVLEKMAGVRPFESADPEHPGKGNWKLPIYGKRKKQPSRSALPIPDYKREMKEAAAKLQKELPPLSTIRQLQERWGMSRGWLTEQVKNGKFSAVQLDHSRALGILRESIVSYVREHGIPQPKPRPQLLVRAS